MRTPLANVKLSKYFERDEMSDDASFFVIIDIGLPLHQEISLQSLQPLPKKETNEATI